ncbi:MAG: hypothetical protein CSA34_03470 [Desulfobulbus propionicus]|nr:MAG: hypothetical protein CSA34_03470 [Desulfobulbus propionicus]
MSCVNNISVGTRLPVKVDTGVLCIDFRSGGDNAASFLHRSLAEYLIFLCFSRFSGGKNSFFEMLKEKNFRLPQQATATTVYGS